MLTLNTMLPRKFVPTWLGLLLLMASARGMRISITEGPSNTTVLRGGTVELRCTFRNGDISRFMWLRSNGAVVTHGTMILDHSRTYVISGDDSIGEYNLVLSDVQPQDADEYSCGFRPMDNEGEVVSVGAFLIVHTPPDSGYPQCTVLPERPSVGDEVKLICSSAGGNPPASLVWYRHDGTVARNETGKSVRRKTLKIDDVGVNFVCEAKSPVEDSPRRCDITPVQIEPSIVFTSQSKMTAGVGDEKSFTCVRVDKPTDTGFSWYYNGNRIDTRYMRRFRVLEEGMTLQIRPLQLRDNGVEIKCELTIYQRFKKHASLTISLADVDDTVTLSYRGDLVTPDDSRWVIENSTNWLPDTFFSDSDIDQSTEVDTNNSEPLAKIILIVCLSSAVVFVFALCLLCCTRGRKKKGTLAVTADASASGPSNRRYNYETSFPPPMGATKDKMFSETGKENESAHYHDIDEDDSAGACGGKRTMASNQSSNNEHIIYQNERLPIASLSADTKQKDPRTSGVYEVPFSKGDYVGIAGDKSGDRKVSCPQGFYQPSNDSNQGPAEYPSAKNVRKKPILRPTKSESNLLNKETRNGYAFDMTGTKSEDICVSGGNTSVDTKVRRITPTSSPLKSVVTRPNNFIVQRKQRTGLTSASNNVTLFQDVRPNSNVSGGKTPDSPRLAHLFKNTAGSPVKPRYSPRTPDKDFTTKQDQDGYEVPKSRSNFGSHQQINDNAEYEQVDHVMMTSPVTSSGQNKRDPGSKGLKGNTSNGNLVHCRDRMSKPGTDKSNEYKELDRSRVGWGSYQPLSPASSTGSSVPPPTSPRYTDSPTNEYETPSGIPDEPSGTASSEYLEILD